MSLGNTHPELTNSPDSPDIRKSSVLDIYADVEIARRMAGDTFREQARKAEKRAVAEKLDALGLSAAEYERIVRDAADELWAGGGEVRRDGYRIEAKEQKVFANRAEGSHFLLHTIQSHKERI